MVRRLLWTRAGELPPPPPHLPPYEEVRTGETFGSIRQELDFEARRVFEREGRRMFVTRRTVLGRWCQHKRALYHAMATRAIEEGRP